MRRRLALLALLFVAHPAAASAAETTKAHIAYLGVLPRSDPERARTLGWFIDALRERGWVEGRNLTLTYRASEGVAGRYAQLAAELVDEHPDVIVPEGPAAVEAVEEQTKTIPIVMFGVPDPVKLGFVASYARPGGNITGVSPATEDVLGKGMQLLTQMRPGISRITYLAYGEPRYWKATQELSIAAARQLGVALNLIPLSSSSDFAAAFSAVAKDPPDALIVSSTPLFTPHAEKFAAFAIAHHLPSLTFNPLMVRRGLLMAYPADNRGLFQSTAAIVDKILRGAKPAEIPVEQPTKFDLIINLKTAQALGLDIPAALRDRADELIQ